MGHPLYQRQQDYFLHLVGYLPLNERTATKMSGNQRGNLGNGPSLSFIARSTPSALGY